MRTVFLVDTFGAVGQEGDVLAVRADRSSIAMPAAARKYQRFTWREDDLPRWTDPEAVRARGKRVRDALRAHAGLVPILDHLVHLPVGKTEPIFVRLAAGHAEMIPWETLCNADDEFMALDARWPIGRISDAADGQSHPACPLQLPVRMMAVISAFNVRGQKKEWEVLAKSVSEARQAGLPVTLHVLVGDAETRAAVQKSIDQGMPDVTIAGIEQTPTRMVQDIVAFAPHLLHFFCHGHAGSAGAEPSLELATNADYLDPEVKVGSVRLRVKQLNGVLAMQSTWLLTLNCCSSGAASTELTSIAHQAVASGFPAAVAMIEPVDARDAHEFTRTFYRALFVDLHRAAAALAGKAVGEMVDFEFAPAMHHARSAICDLHDGDAPNARQWVLPVLYVRGVEPLRLQRTPAVAPGAADDPLQQRLRVVGQWLQQVRESLDEEGRREVMQRMLHGIPEALWPNVDGMFGP